MTAADHQQTEDQNKENSYSESNHGTFMFHIPRPANEEHLLLQNTTMTNRLHFHTRLIRTTQTTRSAGLVEGGATNRAPGTTHSRR